ncbi:MAG: hypothetical protein LBF86_06930 [Helicobacteraceae bacterium]|nr:hypothetical protein [Helicobacteraceae bacterium]
MTARESIVVRFSVPFAVVSVLIAGALALFGGVWHAINALSAAFGAYCAAIASFISYRGMVLRAKSDGVLDTIDDKEGLYEEDAPIDDATKAKNDLAETDANGAKAKIPLKTKAFYAASSFSPIRIIGYAALVLAFFALRANGVFLPAPFLIGLSALPISALIFALIGTRIAKTSERQ